MPRPCTTAASFGPDHSHFHRSPVLEFAQQGEDCIKGKEDVVRALRLEDHPAQWHLDDLKVLLQAGQRFGGQRGQQQVPLRNRP
jgi:hypothetical protein